MPASWSLARSHSATASRPDRCDEGDVVPGVAEGDRGVRPAPAETQLPSRGVEVAARGEGLVQRHDVVLRDRAHDDDARHASRLLTE